MLLNSLYPLIILTIYSVPILIQKIRSGTSSIYRDRFICLLIITLWYIYPDLIHVLFKAFTCVTLKDGSNLLFMDLDIQCWEG